MVLDPTYGTVAPPHDAFPQNPEHVEVVSNVLIVIILAFVGISLLESNRWSSTLPAALTIGSATFTLAEAINCYLGSVYWTTSHDSSKLLFVLLGRDFEVYVALGTITPKLFYTPLGCIRSCRESAQRQTSVLRRQLWKEFTDCMVS